MKPFFALDLFVMFGFLFMLRKMASRAGAAFMKGMKDSLNFVTRSHGFDRLLKTCEVVEGSPGRCVVAYKVQEQDVNKGGTMHGGLGATLVDVVTTIAMVDDETGHLQRPGVTVNLLVNYMNAAKPGEDLLVDARVVKMGSALAFLECEIRKKENGKVVLRGAHTKFVGGTQFNEMAKFQ